MPVCVKGFVNNKCAIFRFSKPRGGFASIGLCARLQLLTGAGANELRSSISGIYHFSDVTSEGNWLFGGEKMEFSIWSLWSRNVGGFLNRCDCYFNRLIREKSFSSLLNSCNNKHFEFLIFPTIITNHFVSIFRYVTHK